MSRFTVFSLVVIVTILAVILAVLGLTSLPENMMGGFLLAVGGIYSVGILIVVVLQRRKFWLSGAARQTIQEEHGDRSFWLIALSMLLAFFAPPLEFLYARALLPRTVWMQAAGMALVLIGTALFMWARRTLKKSYVGHLSVTEAQSLVQNGPYHFIRHPEIAGYFWMSLGLGLGYSSTVGIIFVFLLVLPALVFRIQVEEKLLVNAFGAQYVEYAGQRARMFPGIW